MNRKSVILLFASRFLSLLIIVPQISVAQETPKRTETHAFSQAVVYFELDSGDTVALSNGDHLIIRDDNLLTELSTPMSGRCIGRTTSEVLIPVNITKRYERGPLDFDSGEYVEIPLGPIGEAEIVVKAGTVVCGVRSSTSIWGISINLGEQETFEIRWKE